jgi:stage II sporulation protein D
MRRGSSFSFVGIFGATVLVFFIHSCTAPPPFRDLFNVGEITRAPQIQVGLSDFLRVEVAVVKVNGPGRVHGERFEELSGEVRLRDGKIDVAGRLIEAEEVRITPEWDATLEVGPRRYHGDLLVKRDKDKLTFVNEVDLELYLKGVAGKEMSPSSHPEALKAQIIAARTYAMYEVRAQTLRRVKGEKFDLYDDERSQVYGGMERETDAISALVDETQGMFVVWQDQILKTFYSSTCGGHTEPAWLILGGEAQKIPPLGGTKCDWCAGSKYYEWKESFKKVDAARKLFPDDPKARVARVRIVETLPGGRATKIGITLENHSREKFVEANRGFRIPLGSRRLKSTLWISIEDQGDAFVIHGRGFGHGAGMCQVGAYRMAESGHSGVQILEFYYPGAQVKKLY